MPQPLDPVLRQVVPQVGERLTFLAEHICGGDSEPVEGQFQVFQPK